jgi:hypothetical protein
MLRNTDRFEDLHRSARLLRDTFALPRFDDERYLRWLYRENPNGPALEENVDDGDRRIGHGVGLPQVYHRQGSELSVMILVDIAIAPAARGKGLMSTLNHNLIRAAAERLNVVTSVGVSNASSTPGYTGRLQFRLVRSLPVLLCVPWHVGGWTVPSIEVTPAYLNGGEFDDLVASLDLSPGPGWSQKWSPELLRWRLAAPGADYRLHVTEDLIGVSCKTRAFGVSFAVILKLLPRVAARRGRAAAIVAAACRSHRAPFAVYAGFNARVHVAGIPVPHRLKPAPLNLIFRSLDSSVVRQEDFCFETFEFLDFDVY